MTSDSKRKKIRTSDSEGQSCRAPEWERAAERSNPPAQAVVRVRWCRWECEDGVLFVSGDVKPGLQP